MKIAIVHPFLFRLARGIERFTWSFAQALASPETQVDLLTWSWPEPISWGAPSPYVHIRQVPYSRYFMSRVAVPFYLAWLINGHYDWAMVFWGGYGEAETLHLLGLLRPQRVCFVFHFPYDLAPHRYAEIKTGGLVQHADRLIAVSNYVARGVEAYFGRQCAVIGNGVDPDAFSPSVNARSMERARLNFGPNDPVIVILAALEERKGIQWAIRALPGLMEEFPNLHLLVLGEGVYREALEAEIRRLRLEQHVRLLGHISDVTTYLAAADVGCLLSTGESFGIAVVEYMSMALPVVVSCGPPFDEFIAPAWGIRVNPTDSQAVADALRTLLHSPQQRQEMGSCGRSQVLSHHTWESVAHEYMELLNG